MKATRTPRHSTACDVLKLLRKITSLYRARYAKGVVSIGLLLFEYLVGKGWGEESEWSHRLEELVYANSLSQRSLKQGQLECIVKLVGRGNYCFPKR